ncbi:MAG: helix-turn-helix transcriptional regulator [Pseudonocardia sp.]|nr:helix-turn-helix transcriptional regulator [Pseudonocardia sp.]
MLARSYPDQNCSIARALEVVGERWTLLVLRDVLFGLRRFDEFRASLGIATNVLTARLDRLVTEGLLQRQEYQTRPQRHEYILTDKGRDLAPALLMLMRWGDRHYPSPGGPPRLAVHAGCGGALGEDLHCQRCEGRVDLPDVEFRPAPGAAPAT